MSSNHPTLCIHCGLPVGDPPQLNRLRNGQTCPACRERVLASIPPALPSPRHVPQAREDYLAHGDVLAPRDLHEPPDARKGYPGHAN